MRACVEDINNICSFQVVTNCLVKFALEIAILLRNSLEGLSLFLGTTYIRYIF